MEDFLLKILPICVCSKAVVFFATETISGPCCNATALMQDPEIVSFTETISGLHPEIVSVNLLMLHDPWNRLVYRDPEIVSVNENITALPEHKLLFTLLYLTFAWWPKASIPKQ